MLGRLGRVLTSSLSSAEKPMAVTKGRTSRAAAVSDEEEEAVNMNEEQVEDDDGEDDEEEADEEEYEVNKILDHKQEAGVAKFLVSWKGYGPEHNTWEPEENLHAPDLLKQYWANAPKKEVSRKTTNARASTSQGNKRKSTAAPPSSSKKLKPSSRSTRQESKEIDDDDDHEYSKSHTDETTKYDNEKSWEDFVKTIETVERTETGQLMVYLTMTGGEKISVTTACCHERLPQKMLKFYESHLKWKSIEDA